MTFVNLFMKFFFIFFNFFVDKFSSLGYYKTVMIIITFSKKIFITMQCYLYAFDNE